MRRFAAIMVSGALATLLLPHLGAVLDQQAVDVRLLDRCAAATLADVDQLSIRARKLQRLLHSVRGGGLVTRCAACCLSPQSCQHPHLCPQVVVHNDVCSSNKLDGLQLRVVRPMVGCGWHFHSCRSRRVTVCGVHGTYCQVFHWPWPSAHDPALATSTLAQALPRRYRRQLALVDINPASCYCPCRSVIGHCEHAEATTSTWSFPPHRPPGRLMVCT